MAVLGDSGGSTDDSLQFHIVHTYDSSYQMRTLKLTFIVSFLQQLNYSEFIGYIFNIFPYLLILK